MLVDSNILVYAINISSPKHKKAQEFLKQKQGKFSVAHQNIFETLRILTHPVFPSPMQPQDAIEAVMNIVRAGHIIFPDFKTHELALMFINEHNLVGAQVFDAYLVATALVNDVNVIATDNVKHLKVYKEVKVVNPFS